MPWIATSDNRSYPSIYRKPNALSDDTVLGNNGAYEHIKELRKIAAQEKDSSASDKETKRWWAKRFKGYDYVCKYYEGLSEYNDWRTPRANEEIAPFIDAAFKEIETAFLIDINRSNALLCLCRD